MQGHFHPIHFSSSLKSDDLPATPSNVIVLLRCNLETKPSAFGKAHVFFSNSFKAARYLEPSSNGDESFEAQVLNGDDIWNIANSTDEFSLIIDPCVICGWHEVIQLNKNETQNDLNRKINQALATHRAHFTHVRQQAKNFVDKNEFELAFDLLQVAIQHLDCSDPEAHFLTGICSYRLKDDISLRTAMQNLAALDQSWLDKLSQEIPK